MNGYIIVPMAVNAARMKRCGMLMIDEDAKLEGCISVVCSTRVRCDDRLIRIHRVYPFAQSKLPDGMFWRIEKGEFI